MNFQNLQKITEKMDLCLSCLLPTLSVHLLHKRKYTLTGREWKEKIFPEESKLSRTEGSMKGLEMMPDRQSLPCCLTRDENRAWES